MLRMVKVSSPETECDCCNTLVCTIHSCNVYLKSRFFSDASTSRIAFSWSGHPAGVAGESVAAFEEATIGSEQSLRALLSRASSEFGDEILSWRSRSFVTRSKEKMNVDKNFEFHTFTRIPCRATPLSTNTTSTRIFQRKRIL